MEKSKPFYVFNNRLFTLFLESPGVISSESQGSIWVLFYRECMYCNHSLVKLLWEAVREYHHDRLLGE
jgi:hypothetical protein